VLVRCSSEAALEAVVGQLHRIASDAPRADAPEPFVSIPVRYDGDDLAEVAALTGLDPGEVVELHASAEYQVAFCGFAPGFGYLRGLPAPLHLPRRATPRTRVPTGSVAIAAEYSAVYPGASPGGWHLLGSTEVRLFDVGADPPALLRPGTCVRFEPR
jgi:KipI family sensor histidine kinase inhibitor